MPSDKEKGGPVVSGEQMQAIDHYAIQQLGIPSIVLMENAALRTIDQIDLDHRHSFAIFCGTGNNGGDGLAIARGLIALGKRVKVYLVGHRGHSSQEYQLNYQALVHMGADLQWLESLGDLDKMVKEVQEYNTLIDCLLGTGLSGSIRPPHSVVIEQMNAARIYTLSVDIPSGLEATTGKSLGAYVEADEVVTLQYMKSGLVDNPCIRGPVHVVPIGIPALAAEKVLGQEKDS